jgi:hypothetical protein
MNIRRGLWRTWIVVSILWTLIVSLQIRHAASEIDYVEFYPPERSKAECVAEIPLPEMLRNSEWFMSGRSPRLSSSQIKEYEQRTGKKSSGIDWTKYMEDGELRQEKSKYEGKIKDCMGKGRPDYLLNWATALTMISVPPFILLFMGYVALWIIKGFKSSESGS